MLEYAVVKKDNVYKTVLLTDLPGYLEQGFEEVKEFILVRTTSTDLTSADGFAYKAVPVGIDPSVVRVENMAPADMGKAPDEVEPLPEDAIMLGINDPLPEEMQKEIEESQQEEESSDTEESKEEEPAIVTEQMPSALEFANADSAEPKETVIVGESAEVVAPNPEEALDLAEEVKPEALAEEVKVEVSEPEVVVETPPVEAAVVTPEPAPVVTPVVTPDATPAVAPESAPVVTPEVKIEEIAPELNEEPKA